MSASRAKLYERLMEAQEHIAAAQYRQGVSHATVLAALDTADERITEDERHEDLFVSALVHFVKALGGQLEIRAVFGDEAVVVRSEPVGRR